MGLMQLYKLLFSTYKNNNSDNEKVIEIQSDFQVMTPKYRLSLGLFIYLTR